MVLGGTDSSILLGSLTQVRPKATWSLLSNFRFLHYKLIPNDSLQKFSGMVQYKNHIDLLKSLLLLFLNLSALLRTSCFLHGTLNFDIGPQSNLWNNSQRKHSLKLAVPKSQERKESNRFTSKLLHCLIDSKMYLLGSTDLNGQKRKKASSFSFGYNNLFPRSMFEIACYFFGRATCFSIDGGKFHDEIISSSLLTDSLKSQF